MTEIKAFNGTRYNNIIIDIAKVVAPPYDVINETQQDVFYKMHPYNVIRLILGKQHEDDNENNNRYTRAKRFIDEWKEKGILIRDDEPSIYLYVQKYKIGNKNYERRGFIALMRLDSEIYKHEKTLTKPKEDRFELMKTCNGNLSPIFVLYDDKKKCVECITINPKIHIPIAHLKDGEVEHFFYKVPDKKIISIITDMIGKQRVYIADGHHRYETALKYRDYMFSKYGKDDDADYNYVMSYFTNMSDDGLVILPTHRVVHNVKYRDEEVLDKLRAGFSIKQFLAAPDKNKIEQWLSEIGKNNKGFGVKFYDSDKLYILYDYKPFNLKKDNSSDVLKSLDVYILNKEILEHIFDIGEVDLSRGEKLSYFHNINEALNSMIKGDVIFVLNPPSAMDVKAVALASLTMPQKTTFFYPKLLSGLVFNFFNIKQ